ncbi:MAG: hypothetical protein ACTSSN_13410 [Candidatus Heimdallarchaeaceae archaeon]
MANTIYLQKRNTTADGKKSKMYLTSGILSEYNPISIEKMTSYALDKLIGNTTWVVFTLEAKKCYLEDEGRTCIVPLLWMDKAAPEKVYAILADYGSAEALQESAGDKTITTQFVLTLLLAEDY